MLPLEESAVLRADNVAALNRNLAVSVENRSVSDENRGVLDKNWRKAIRRMSSVNILPLGQPCGARLVIKLATLAH